MQPEFSPKTKENIHEPLVNTRIQPKLEVAPPHNRYEQEADKVADKISQMPGNFSGGLQMVPKEDEEEKIQMKPEKEKESLKMKPEDEEKEKIQMYSGNSADKQVPKVSSALTNNLESTKGQGNSLPENVNSEMSRKIGADFSNVRIHNDAGAVQMNKELGAQAFTHGNDIYFNNGKFNPESSSGKHLLAHELTHTIQQSENSKIQNKVIQCEWEIEPTVANPVIRVLTAGELRTALNFDRVVFTDADEITLLRTILGESGIPAVVDEDFVNAIVRYQAAYGLDQDGIVGAGTARQLAAELGVEATNAGADADVGDATTMALNPAQRRMQLRSRVANRLGRLVHQGFIGPRDNPTGIITVRTGVNYQALIAAGLNATNGIQVDYTGANANNAHWLQFISARMYFGPASSRVYQTGSTPLSIATLNFSSASTINWLVDSSNATNPYYEAGYTNVRTSGVGTSIFDQPQNWHGLAESFAAAQAARPAQVTLVLGFDTNLIINNRCNYHVRWNMTFNFNTSVSPTTDVGGSHSIISAGSRTALPADEKTALDSRYAGNTIH